MARTTLEEANATREGQYVVVARRYRPQRFEELIGQEHVARALSNAITTDRVGHAYLFTGARGVGKTSAARILAKALDCEQGPTPTPCNKCEICQGISSGDDVDVLEMDGASNRGIDQIRDLRSNVSVRPSRARFKIYIIDEVHMLTKEAFNALLKTLEEPPEHVKFIFCTTEAEKIPITILSRCQRFDFAGIQAGSIAQRLEQIAKVEGVEVEPEAIEILARRAAGSMRDSQSLLEQLLAFGGQRITVADVHAMLGTAAEGRLGQLVAHMMNRDAAACLKALDAALLEGVDVGQLLDQLLGYFRDVMTACVGCPPETFLHVSRSEQEGVRQASQRLGLATVLAAMQIIDQTLARLRYSTARRTLAELALAKICALEDLEQIGELVNQLRSGVPAISAAGAPSPSRATAEPTVKKKSIEVPALAAGTEYSVPSTQYSVLSTHDPRQESHDPSSQGYDPSPHDSSPKSRVELSAESAETLWRQVLDQMGDMIADNAAFAERVAISGPNRLVVSFPAKYTSCKAFCEHPERTARLEEALSRAIGQSVQLEFRVDNGVARAAVEEAAPSRPLSQRARLAEKSQNPLVRRAEELFKATAVAIEDS
jgi:DNA polymerase-3 subunit gamma/tau